MQRNARGGRAKTAAGNGSGQLVGHQSAVTADDDLHAGDPDHDQLHVVVMHPTLGAIGGIVIVANLMTVWFVWSLRRFGETKGKPQGPGIWAWAGALIPGLLAAMALLAAATPLSH